MDVLPADGHQLVDAARVDVQMCVAVGLSLEYQLGIVPRLTKIGRAAVPDAVAVVGSGGKLTPAEVYDVALNLHLHLLVVGAFVLGVALGQVHPVTIVTRYAVA